MPCNSDYLDASHKEITMSRVVMLLEEAKTGKHVNADSSDWRGYHDAVYNQNITKGDLDTAVAALCARIEAFSEKRLAESSLELQIWWREHQKADTARRKREADIEAIRQAKDSALSKLTDEEKKALGLK